MKDQHGDEAVAMPTGLVAAAEREILQELWDSTDEADRIRAEQGESAARRARLAAVLLVACVAFTLVNVVAATRSRDGARQDRDALAAIEFVAADLEAERARSGAYPERFTDLFDDPAWRYERVTPDHFLLHVSAPDGELVYDSAVGQVRRIALAAAAGGAR